jgi:hypothetical protein
MASYDYEEKRDFVRMRVNTPVNYSLNGTDVIHQGNSMDLSATGLFMETEFKPEVGDQIEVIMNPSSDKLPPFLAQGKVVRVDISSDKAHHFNVSVELTKTM